MCELGSLLLRKGPSSFTNEARNPTSNSVQALANGSASAVPNKNEEQSRRSRNHYTCMEVIAGEEHLVSFVQIDLQ